MSDQTEVLLEQVNDARTRGEKLAIVGGNSKAFLGRDPGTHTVADKTIETSGHTGIVEYSPTELVMTARAGTALSDIVAVLDNENQMLPFEPPLFDGKATIGGTLAADMSGPARPWWGSVRDSVLGVRLINGLGEHLRFGGVVMKNVAGYDLSRFQAGAMGTLGLITEVSFKVLPKPAVSKTLWYELTEQDAIDRLARFQRQPKPLSGACWIGGLLRVRLSGAEAAVEGTATQWGGEIDPDGEQFWKQLQELKLPFFADEKHSLWRYSCATSAPASGDDMLIDWGGALRWSRGEAPVSLPDSQVSRYRSGDGQSASAWLPEPAVSIRTLIERVKRATDPDCLFNPGRLYRWL